MGIDAKTNWRYDDTVTHDDFNRIERNTSQLEKNKANKDDVFSMDNMGQDIREAMTGGSVAVVGKDAVDTMNLKNNSVTKEKVDFISNVSANLYDETKSEQNSYIDSTTGNVISGVSGYTSSDFIPVKHGVKITVSKLTQIARFDENKSYTSGWDMPTDTRNYTFDTDGSFYIRFSYPSDSVNVMVNYGSVIQEYAPYSDDSILADNVKVYARNVNGLSEPSEIVYDTRLAKINKNKVEILLPKNIYLPESKEFWCYFNNIVSNYDIFSHMMIGDVKVTASDNAYKKNADRVVLTGSGAVNISLLDYRDENIYWKKGSEVITGIEFNINRKTVTSGKTINTLFIGDSYFRYSATGGTGVLGYIKKFAEDDGNTIAGKGTSDCCGVQAEAIGGWTESDFYSSTSSPFVFNGVFNFSKYLSENGISGVDNVVFHLGMNGGVGTDLNNMIANIKSTLPSCKIFICMVPSTGLNCVPTNNWYHDVYETQRTRDIQNKSYISLFDGKENSGIYLIPENASFNRECGLVAQEYNKYQFGNIKEAGMSDHHPSDIGEQEIAYLIYNYLMYFN